MSCLKTLYTNKCEEYGTKPNSAVLALLPERGRADELTVLDLSANVIGLKGLLPLLEVVKAAPKLTTLNLADNQLTSAATGEIGKHLAGHHSLTHLDLSRNVLPLGGESLLQLAKASPKLTLLNITDTQVRPLFVKLIEYQLRKNAGAAAMEPPPAEEAQQQQQEEAEPGYNFGGFSFGGGGGGDEDEEGSEEDEEERANGKSEDEIDEEEEARQAARAKALAAAGNRRMTVSSEVISRKEMENFQARVVEKPQEHVEWLMQTLEPVHLFSHLEDFELLVAVKAMEPLTLSRGDIALAEGEEGSRFLLIKEGAAEESREGNTLASLRSGDTIGETDLLYPTPHQHSVTVASETLFAYQLDRQTYRHIVTKSSAEKRERYMSFLQKVNFLKNMRSQELMQLADALKSTTYQQGDTIIAHGSEGQWFHIITEGTVEVIGRFEGIEKRVCTFTVGECVGELEFINKHKCVADVKALTPEVRTAKMNRKHFEKVMGPCVDVLRRVADTSEVYEYYRGTQKGDA